jgi:hypothetical protein
MNTRAKNLSRLIIVGICLSILVSCTPSKKAASSKPKGATSDTSIVLGQGFGPIDGVINGTTETVVGYSDNYSPLSVRDTSLTDSETGPELDSVLLPTATLLVPDLPPSAAELAVLAPSPSVKVGSIDNDAGAAAPDREAPLRIEASVPPELPPTTLPQITVPDLGLDSAPADALMSKAVFPVGLTPQPAGDADIAGNAVANAFADDARLKAALRSGSGRAFVRTVGQASEVFVGAIVIVDPASLGPSLTDEVTRTFQSQGTTTVSTFEGKPLVTVDLKNGLREYIAVVGDRLIAAGGAATTDETIKDLLRALIKVA